MDRNLNAPLHEREACDAELNDVYQQVLREYSSDQAFVAALREAQRAWFVFRNAEIIAFFPEREASRVRFRSPHIGDASLVAGRVEEGDVCAGSVRIK